MENLDQKSLFAVIQFVTTFLVGLFGWFAKKTLARIEEDIKINSLQITALENLKTDTMLIKKDIDLLLFEAKNIRSQGEDLAVLKRDQKSIWGRVDELRIKFDAIGSVLIDTRRRSK